MKEKVNLVKEFKHVEKLMRLSKRRLELLEEKEAIKGIDTEPQIIIEIEELREKLAEHRGKALLLTQMLDRAFENDKLLTIWNDQLRDVLGRANELSAQLNDALNRLEKDLHKFVGKNELQRDRLITNFEILFKEWTQAAKDTIGLFQCPVCSATLTAFDQERNFVRYRCGYSVQSEEELSPCLSKNNG